MFMCTHALTILWSGEGEATTEGAHPNRRHRGDDTDVVPVGEESGDGEGGGRGGEAECHASLHDCHINHVADDNAIL